LKPAIAYFDQRVAGARDAHVLVFVHGYNTNFEEAVYGFAQFVHDSNTPELVPVLFTWPSRGRLFDYAYDRESALYSRDALEVVLNAMAKNPKVKSISIVAHSMGNFLTVETLRQMAIRDRVLSPKIKDIVLASPDIDVDVFRRQIEQIEASDKAPPITLLVSQDDRALTFSRFIAGDAARLGAIDPTAERFRSILEKAHVQVIDLTKFDSNDPTNHRKFATSEFVKVIGRRLASGQTLADSKITLGQAVVGAATKITSTVATAVAAPVSLFDPSATAPPDVQASSLLQ